VIWVVGIRGGSGRGSACIQQRVDTTVGAKRSGSGCGKRTGIGMMVPVFAVSAVSAVSGLDPVGSFKWPCTARTGCSGCSGRSGCRADHKSADSRGGGRAGGRGRGRGAHART
jgi:hypothetical protein